MMERKRVILLKDLNNTEAKRITKNYPNVIVFSEHEGKNGIHHDIYKGGINYTTFSDVDKDMNKFILHGNSIILQKTDERKLKLIEYKTYLQDSLNGEKVDSNIYELSTSSKNNYLKIGSDMTFTANNIKILVGEDLIETSVTTNPNQLVIKPKHTYNDGIGTCLIKFEIDEDIFSYIIIDLVFKDNENNLSITLNYQSIDIYKNQQIQLSAVVKPETYRDKYVVFESADPNIATVDGNGIIRSVECGSVTITVSLYNNPSIYKTCIVNVIADEVNISTGTIMDQIYARIPNGVVDASFENILDVRVDSYERDDMSQTTPIGGRT